MALGYLFSGVGSIAAEATQLASDVGFCFLGLTGLVYAVCWPVLLLGVFRADSM